MRYVPDSFLHLYEACPVWLRSFASTSYGILKHRKEEGRAFRDCYRELEESQWWPSWKLDELQSDRLQRLVRHADVHVPYYRRLFADYGINPSQIQTPADLRLIPTLSKETVRKQLGHLLADTCSRSRLLSEATSGTTGTPLTVLMNEDAYLSAKAAQWLHHAWGGYTHKEWIGILAGYNVIPAEYQGPPFWITNHFGRQIHFSTRHLKPDIAHAYVEKMRQSNVRFLLGYPSAIGLLARYMLAKGLHLPIETVFLSSEPFSPWQVEAITRAFDCRTFNYFGQAEKVLTAASCGNSLDLHLHQELCVAEVEQVNGTEGLVRLLGTSLTNFAMPLIRYELHDLTTLGKGPCPCGRKHALIGPVVTVRDSYLLLPDGSLVAPSLLYHPFQSIRGVLSSQIVQEERDRIVVSLVSDVRFTREEEDRLRHRLRLLLGKGVRLEFARVQCIQRPKNQKFRFVVSRFGDGAVESGAAAG